VVTDNIVSWRRKAADEFEAQARAVPRGKRRQSLLRRGTAFRLCATQARVDKCRDCGELRAGSGELTTPDGGYPCNERTCPYCDRREGARLRARLEAATESVEPRKGFSSKHITLTTQYDPGDEHDVTVEALRERALGLKHAIDVAWRKGLGQPGAGLFWRMELGDHGAVHAHLFYFGPFIPKDWLETTLKRAYDRCGFVWFSYTGDAKEKIREVVKYATKTGSPLNERWITSGMEVMDPKLAARWAVATTSQRLHGSRGVLRLPAEAPRREPREFEPVVWVDGLGTEFGWLPHHLRYLGSPYTKCLGCGGDAFEKVNLDLVGYTRHQHARHRIALRGTRVPPPAGDALPRPVYTIATPPVAQWSPVDDAAPAVKAAAGAEWTEEWL
jgi:hypothetical protein